MSKKRYAVIVAGGSGTRMQTDRPKQFLMLEGKPIMAHTINRFLSSNCEVIVVLPADHFLTFKEDVLHHCHSQEMILAQGGETRFHSVKNGLDLVKKDSLVAIHDAVRPLVSLKDIELSFTEAEKHGCAVVSVPLKDSIRQVSKNGHNNAVNRSDFYLIQTPQTFRSELLLDSYTCAYNSSFTDDASVFEQQGNKIHLVEGDYRNIKITTPEDLTVAKALLNEKL